MDFSPILPSLSLALCGGGDEVAITILTVCSTEQSFKFYQDPTQYFFLSLVMLLCQTQGHLNFPLLPSRNIVVMYSTVRSLIHFELIFVKSMSSISRFVCLFVCFLAWGCLAPCLEQSIFAPSYCFCSFFKD